MLTSRLIDRPLRPMFAPGWSNDTQVKAYLILDLERMISVGAKVLLYRHAIAAGWWWEDVLLA